MGDVEYFRKLNDSTTGRNKRLGGTEKSTVTIF